MNSIPPLIPVPKSQEKNLDEEMIDKFATLFSPPTPRASPTREINDGDSIWKTPAPSRPPAQQHWEPSTPDSEFGAFVSVPASEDPLADADADFSFGESQSQGGGQGQGHAKSSSLSFFDQFAKEAKDASERNRKEVLDELLDPLGSSWGATGSSQPQQPAGNHEHEHEHDPDSWGPPELSESLIDLDHEFFSPSSPGTSDRHHRRSRTVESHTHPSRQQTSSSVGSLGRSPSRSPTLPTLAPPVTSGADAQAQVQDSARPGLSTRSTSYQTLSSISAKWMSGLLSSAAAASSSTSTSTSTSPPPTGRGSIDSLFFLHERTFVTTGLPPQRRRRIITQWEQLALLIPTHTHHSHRMCSYRGVSAVHLVSRGSGMIGIGKGTRTS
ncbi:oxidation resistance protein 1 [Marasmius tenuissimus]|uniref:Oxidation resistance protein 1 n=1 Tax=Marasmius tenuissimus TaxID=585030 RepID=A0ABR2ZH31_9AGAR